MAPIIHCVRHAQGFHNVSLEGLNTQDPVLTSFGEQQCGTLSEAFPSHANISLIIASPLVRTLQTAFLSFAPVFKTGSCAPKVIALPEAQETSALISDCGSDPPVLRKIVEQNGWPVDLDLVHVNWNIKSAGSRWEPTYEATAKRAREARGFVWEKVQQLQAQGCVSPEIVFVTHGGFLHYFTEDWEGSGVDLAYKTGRTSEMRWDIPGTAWKNTEVRSYYIGSSETETDNNPWLLETPESRQFRVPLDQKQEDSPPLNELRLHKGLRDYEALLYASNLTASASGSINRELCFAEVNGKVVVKA